MFETWPTILLAEASLIEPFEFENREYLTKRIPALLSMNSRRLLSFLIEYLEQGKLVQTEEERLMLNMFYYTFYRSEPQKQGYLDIDHAVQFIVSCNTFKEEITEIRKYNYAHINFVDKRNEFPYACPLDLHCTYSTDQVLAAFGFWNEEKAPAFRYFLYYTE